jgi:hypothetical protein
MPLDAPDWPLSDALRTKKVKHLNVGIGREAAIASPDIESERRAG